MLDGILKLTCDMLDASCQHVEPAQREGAYGGPLWDRKLPGSRNVVPFIRDFAQAGGSARIAINDRPLCTLKLNGEAEFDNNVLSVPYLRQLFSGQQERSVQQISASVHEKAPSLLSKKWTAFGIAKIRLGTLIPQVSWAETNGGEAVFSWSDPPTVQIQTKGPLGLIDWNVGAFITSIRIGEFKGRVLFSRRLASLLAPDLEWAP